MKKTIQYLLIFQMIYLALGVELYPAETGVQLRLYEGWREKDFITPRVISSYHLNPISQKMNFSNIPVSKERDSLKRVFNLKEVKLITFGNLIIQDKNKQKSSQLFVLNQKNLTIELNMISQQKNQFQLNVIENEKKTAPLLETKIIIPHSKTVVIGFEDSEKKIYFISLFRASTGDAQKTKTIFRRTYQKPELIERINPEYPEEAKEQGIQGLEILQAQIDISGKVSNLESIKTTHSLLSQSAMVAIKQWKYTPGIVSGKPTPVPLTVLVNFILEKTSRQPVLGSVRFSIDSTRLRLIKRVAPVYPIGALKKNIQGKVIIMAFIDKNGYISHTKVFKGNPILARASVAAMKQWRFEPYILGGKRQSILFTVTVDFNLEREIEK
ncbi:MAG: energy transducer TonB [Candidatus Aminicenantes bacterium]|nr:energy transducer TonB [Candidatus Aminicenantes bacterium]